MPGKDSTDAARDYRLKRHELYRSRIQYEDFLFNQKINWLLTSQAFLMVPFIMSFGSTQSGNPILKTVQSYAPVFGVLACLLALMSSVAALCAIGNIGRAYKNIVSEEEKNGIHDPDLPAIDSPGILNCIGLSGPIGLILLLLVIWIIFMQRLPDAALFRYFLLALGLTAIVLIAFLAGRRSR